MLEEVIAIISKYQGKKAKKIDADSVLTKIGLSSFDVVNLVCTFEDRFNIEIPDREIATVRTVGDVAAVVKKLTLLQ